MNQWTIAGVQMDCRFADKDHNLEKIRIRLAEAAGQGARLIVFPECAVPGYCFESKAEAWPYAEPIPGPSTQALATDCRELGVWSVVGLLEAGEAGRLFNACVLIGPEGIVAKYRKI